MDQQSYHQDVPSWVQTQHKTFTAWANSKLQANHDIEHNSALKSAYTGPMNDLISGFHTGVNLCLLIHYLTHADFAFEKTPKSQFQFLSNVQMALETLQKNNPDVHLISIDANSIAHGDLKLVLGLVWQLIVAYEAKDLKDHYHQQYSPRSQKENPNGQINKQQPLSKKDLLLQWINSILRQANSPATITNFTTDWTSGDNLIQFTQAVKTLFQKQGMELDPHETMSWEPLRRATTAFDLLKSHLNIPVIMSPEDVVNAPDELSLMTYFLCARAVVNDNLLNTSDGSSGVTAARQQSSSSSSSTHQAPNFEVTEFSMKNVVPPSTSINPTPPARTTVHPPVAVDISVPIPDHVPTLDIKAPPQFPSSETTIHDTTRLSNNEYDDRVSPRADTVIVNHHHHHHNHVSDNRVTNNAYNTYNDQVEYPDVPQAQQENFYSEQMSQLSLNDSIPTDGLSGLPYPQQDVAPYPQDNAPYPSNGVAQADNFVAPQYDQYQYSMQQQQQQQAYYGAPPPAQTSQYGYDMTAYSSTTSSTTYYQQGFPPQPYAQPQYYGATGVQPVYTQVAPPPQMMVGSSVTTVHVVSKKKFKKMAKHGNFY